MKRRSWMIPALAAAALTIALPATASALTKTVYAGPPHNGAAKRLLGSAFIRTYAPDANTFFQRTVTINKGDTVKFLINGFHTVDIPASGGSDLPFIIPGATVTGTNDAAGNPFWFNGHVPSLGLNPKLLAPIGRSPYDGSKRIDTGIFMGNGNPPPFNVTFTKPGTYKYYCDVHPGMVGHVVVLARGRRIPSARQDAAALNTQVNSTVLSLKKAASRKVAANQVSLGVAVSNGGELFAMFPSRLSVKAGTVVTFFMSRGTYEAHSATFGPTGYLMAAANSITSPAPQQQAFYPSSPGVPSLSPTSHGNGFANTGVLDRDPTTPLPSSGKIKFTTPGTYHYICIIHPFMKGTIVVR